MLALDSDKVTWMSRSLPPNKSIFVFSKLALFTIVIGNNNMSKCRDGTGSWHCELSVAGNRAQGNVRGPGTDGSSGSVNSPSPATPSLQ